jgi:hypothetical protein
MQANSPNDLIVDQNRGALLDFVLARPLDTLAQEFSTAFAIDAVLFSGVPTYEGRDIRSACRVTLHRDWRDK